MNGSDGGDEGDNIARDREKGFDAEEGSRVLTRFLQNVASLEAGGGETANVFKLIDFGAKIIGGDGERENKVRERNGGEDKDGTENQLVSEENLKGMVEDRDRGNTAHHNIP